MAKDLPLILVGAMVMGYVYDFLLATHMFGL